MAPRKKTPYSDSIANNSDNSGHQEQNTEIQEVVCRKFYPSCVVQIGGVDLPADLVLLEMSDFDVILGMDWLVGYHASMDCFHKTLTFKLEETQAGVLFQGERRSSRAGFISALKADRLLRSGCVGYLAFITEDKRSQGVEEILIFCEFPDVFPEEITGCHPSERWTSLLSCYRGQLQFL